MPVSAPVSVSTVTLLVSNKVPRAAPVMSPPVAAIVKSTGSINQVPVLPAGAAVVMRAVSASLTCAALVSIKPPLPPLGALASSVPPTCVVPAAMPPNKTMLPAWFSTVRASMTPVLLTTLASSASCAPALISTRPPFARITPPLALWLSSTLWSIFTWTKLLF